MIIKTAKTTKQKYNKQQQQQQQTIANKIYCTSLICFNNNSFGITINICV